MWGWLVVVIIIIIVWGIGGAVTNGLANNPSSLPGGCAGCKVLQDWWRALPPWRKTWYFAFYCWKKVFCYTSC